MAEHRAPFADLVGATAGDACPACGLATLDKGEQACKNHFEGIEKGDTLV